MQTAVEWLEQELKKIPFVNVIDVFEQAKEMEKQQIIDAFGIGCHHESKRLVGYQDIAEQYYTSTYGSKGSNETNGNNVEKVPNVTSSQTEISDEQAIEMLKDINKQPMRFHCVPKEISNEEIEKYAKQNAFQYYEFITGAKWYREQLKSKQ